MYESPIELYMTDITRQVIKQQEEQILKAVQSVAVGVDHDELLRALRFDRNQYEKGYRDGVADAKPKWIPVSERLPENDTAVIVATDNGMVFQCLYAYDGWDLWDGYTVNITHWMPLPESPKEE